MAIQEIPENTSQPLQDRIRQVTTRIREAEQQYDRVAGEVQLLAVSKTWPVEDIVCATQLGLQAFGESYLQEAAEKITALAPLNLQWHFIGPIQSNKTQIIARLFDWVHSVEREKIARRLNEQRPDNLPPLNICLQVNISGEASKSGVAPDELTALAQQISTLPRLRLRGLMAIPAPTANFGAQREAFHRVHEAFIQLKAQLNESGQALDTLSMGMSGDLEAAIAEGATMVRVGTDIFGPRNPGQAVPV